MKLSGDIWGKTRTAVTMTMPADRARGRSRSDPSTCSTRGRQPLRERRNSRAIIATNDRLGGARSRARHATEAADRACEPRPPRQGSHRPSAGHEASARRRGVALEASRVCTADAAYRHCRRERAEQVALVALDLLDRDAREALPERVALLVRRDVGEAHRAPRGSRQAAAFSGKGVQP
jgi:hypothetical protein